MSSIIRKQITSLPNQKEKSPFGFLKTKPIKFMPQFPDSLFNSQKSQKSQELKLIKGKSLPIGKKRRMTSSTSLFKEMIERKSKELVPSIIYREYIDKLKTRVNKIEIDKQELQEEYKNFILLKGLLEDLNTDFNITTTDKSTTFIEYLNIKDEIQSILNSLDLLYDKLKNDRINRTSILNIIYDLRGEGTFKSLFRATRENREITTDFKDEKYPILSKIRNFIEVKEILKEFFNKTNILLFEFYFDENEDDNLEKEIRPFVFNILVEIHKIADKFYKKIDERRGGNHKIKKVLKKN